MKLKKGPALKSDEDNPNLFCVKVWKDNPKKTGLFIAVGETENRANDVARVLMALWEAANPEFNIIPPIDIDNPKHRRVEFPD